MACRGKTMCEYPSRKKPYLLSCDRSQGRVSLFNVRHITCALLVALLRDKGGGRMKATYSRGSVFPPLSPHFIMYILTALCRSAGEDAAKQEAKLVIMRNVGGKMLRPTEANHLRNFTGPHMDGSNEARTMHFNHHSFAAENAGTDLHNVRLISNDAGAQLRKAKLQFPLHHPSITECCSKRWRSQDGCSASVEVHVVDLDAQP